MLCPLMKGLNDLKQIWRKLENVLAIQGGKFCYAVISTPNQSSGDAKGCKRSDRRGSLLEEWASESNLPRLNSRIRLRTSAR